MLGNRWIALAFFSFSLFPLFHGAANASTFPSQTRAPDESFVEARERFLSRPDVRLLEGSVEGSAVSVDQLDISTAVEWPRSADLTAEFRKVRDDRFLKQEARPDFPRRISWLYPDDGCYARASMVGNREEAYGMPRPSKLFVFGDLSVKTPNAPGGAVYWWYHVVPAIRYQGNLYVFDPAIDPSTPLGWKDWLYKMSSDLTSVKVSLCSPFSHSPDSSCEKATRQDESGAEDEQGFFLASEWDRVVELGHDPELELGDNPPWRQTGVRRASARGASSRAAALTLPSR